MFALIEQHIAKEHSTDQWKKCEQCEFTGSKHMLQCHMYYYHPKGPELICDTCGYRTPHNSVLKQHIRMVHQKIKPYSCGKCHRSFFSESRLKDHDIVFHNNQMFICDICKKSYKIRRQLQVHIRSVHQGIWIHCPQCNLKFAENHDLKRHKALRHESIHEAVRYPCNQCNYSATQIGNLNQHKASKHDMIKHPCDQCDYSTPRIGDLKRHRAAKHEEHRYPCDQCIYVTKTLANLKQHKASAHEGVRYLCDQCDYSATNSSNLNKHRNSKHKVTKS